VLPEGASMISRIPSGWRRLMADELILSFAPGGTAYLAEHDPHEGATHPPGTPAKPDGVFAGRNADQAVDCRQQSVGRQRIAHSGLLWPTERSIRRSWRNWGGERLQLEEADFAIQTSRCQLTPPLSREIMPDASQHVVTERLRMHHRENARC
jgi:hypothetical protein